MGKQEDRREALGTRVAASKTTIIPDDKFIGVFSDNLRASLPSRTSACDLLVSKLSPLKGNKVTLSMIDQHAKDVVNRITPQLREEDKLEFRESVVASFETALAKTVPAPAAVQPQKTVPSSPQTSHTAKITCDNRTPTEKFLGLKAGERHPGMAPRDFSTGAIMPENAPRSAPPKPIMDTLTSQLEFLPGYKYEYDQALQVPLAFRFSDRAACDKFAKIFHDYGKPEPYIGFGRLAFPASDSNKRPPVMIKIESHYRLGDQGVCWVEFKKVRQTSHTHEDAFHGYEPVNENEPLSMEDTEDAKQFVLKYLLLESMINRETADKAGYKEGATGGLVAHDQKYLPKLYTGRG